MMTTERYINSLQFWEKLKSYLEQCENSNPALFEDQQLLLRIAEKRTDVFRGSIKTTPERMQEIFEHVCRQYGANPELVKQNNGTRKREFVEIRQLTFYAWQKEGLKINLAMAGRFFEKDHATVIHALQTVKNLRQTDKEYRKRTDEILMI